MDASSLHCPNCGAAADPDARRCPYCKARLATVSCPSCFALMFDGVGFCPACGAPRTRADTNAAGVACPACKGTMKEVEIGARMLRECAHCDAVWLDAATFEHLCADKETQAAVLHRVHRAAAVEAGAQPVRYRSCPTCGKMMNRVNFGKMSGAVVDVCRGHGTLLDAGELHQIVSFIQQGGLERTRQREIEELKEEQRRLKALQDALRVKGSTEL